MPTVTNTGPLALAASLVVALAVPASPAEKPADKRAPQAAAKAPADAVADHRGETITSAQFEELAGPRLFAARTQEYNQKRALLEDAIDAKLLDKEGKARGISADELIRVEVDAKVRP
jgi:hypothetical protein